MSLYKEFLGLVQSFEAVLKAICINILIIVIVVIFVIVIRHLVLLIKFVKVIMDKQRVAEYLLISSTSRGKISSTQYVEPSGRHPFSEMPSGSNHFVKEDSHILATRLACLICKINTELQGGNKDILINLPSFAYFFSKSLVLIAFTDFSHG